MPWERVEEGEYRNREVMIGEVDNVNVTKDRKGGKAAAVVGSKAAAGKKELRSAKI